MNCPSCNLPIDDVAEFQGKEIFCPHCWQPLFVGKKNQPTPKKWKREKIVVRPAIADTTEWVDPTPPRPIPVSKCRSMAPIAAAMFLLAMICTAVGIRLGSGSPAPVQAQAVEKPEILPVFQSVQTIPMPEMEINYRTPDATPVEVTPENPPLEAPVEPPAPQRHLPNEIIEFTVIRPYTGFGGAAGLNRAELKAMQSQRWSAEEELPAGVIIDYGDSFLWQYGGRTVQGDHVTVSSTKALQYYLLVKLDGKTRGPIQIDPDSGNWQRKR